jgi:hypothetical protein
LTLASSSEDAERERGGVLIDRFLPKYDEIEHHEVHVDAPVERTYRAVKELDLARSPVVLALLAVRGIPTLFTGAVKPRLRLGLDEVFQSGFVVLGEEPDRELVLGIVGKFWQLTSGVNRIQADEFIGFDEPGFAKAAWNFVVADGPVGGSTVVTQTRVKCTDEDARRKFGWYWRLVGPFSALIRRELLRTIRQDAEARE